KGEKSPELAQIEVLGLFSINGSILAKAEMINALTNTMKVNKENLGTYHNLRDKSYEKLMAVISSINI
ncbi:MAG: hypothetical protein Q8R90_03790, partial [Bacteroidales bacterium]|nr:hypothetical protein [Bacteroidales bacterium]